MFQQPPQQDTRPLSQEERQAWDLYAASIYGSILRSIPLLQPSPGNYHFPIRPEPIAQAAAHGADVLMLERRKRKPVTAITPDAAPEQLNPED